MKWLKKIIKMLNRWIKTIKKVSEIYKEEPELIEELIKSKDPVDTVDDYFSKDDKIKSKRYKLNQKLLKEYPTKSVYYNGRYLPLSSDRIKVPVQVLITPEDPKIISDLKKWNLYRPNISPDELALKVYKKYMKTYYRYKYDKDNWNGLSEFWEFPFELYAKYGDNMWQADCLEENTLIKTEKGMKKIKDIEVGDYVLSYDFDNKKQVYKKVTNKWDKGILPTKKVKFSGGTEVIATEDHDFYVRDRQNYKNAEYEKKSLKDIDLSRWWTRKVPYIKQMNREVNDIEWLSKDLCWLLGHYVAEGWGAKNGKSKFLCGDEEETYLNIMDKEGLDYKIQKPNHAGVPQVRLNVSERNKNILDLMEECGKKACVKRIPEKIKLLPEEKLREFYKGYFEGDGTVDYSKGYARYSLSTISEQLADDLLEVLNYLGHAAGKSLTKDSGGFINSPIYRIQYSEKSYRLKDYGYDELSESTIRSVEDNEEAHVYDIEVEGTHNFVLSNGVVVGNCDSHAIALVSYMRAAGVPAGYCWVVAGNCEGGGHCFTGDTLIKTNEGQKQIKDIEEGDLVLTKKGYNKVLDTFKRNLKNDEKMYELSVSGVPEKISATEGHKFFVKRGKIKGFSFKNSFSSGFFDNPQEIPLKDIKKGDWLYHPIDDSIKDEENITENICRLFGYYLGDGNINYRYSKNGKVKSGRLRFSLGINKKENKIKEDIEYILEKEFNIAKGRINYYKSKNSEYEILTIFDTKLTKFVDKYCGKLDNKNMDKLINLPTKKQKNILYGLFMTDGNIHKGKEKDNKIILTNTNRNIIYSTIDILKRMRISYFINKYPPREDKKIKGKKDIYTLGIQNCDFNFEQKTNKNSVVKYIGKYAVSRVRDKKTTANEEYVYDLQVDKEHNYCANGILVHNSTVYVFSEEDNKFHHLNSTTSYYKNKNKKLTDFPTHDDAPENDKMGIYKVWFSFNDLVARSTFSDKKIADIIEIK